jgi:hypothetical protein
VTPDPNDPALAVEEPPTAGSPGLDNPPDAAPGNPSPTRWLKEAAVVVVVAVLVAVLLRAFVVQTFFIPSGSMEPTLQIGDRILVNKVSYHLHGVDRGDIVVFSRPRRRHLARERLRLRRREEARRELAPGLRAGHHGGGTRRQHLEPGPPLPGACRQLLRDG